jgi:hypothetical protein
LKSGICLTFILCYSCSVTLTLLHLFLLILGSWELTIMLKILYSLLSYTSFCCFYFMDSNISIWQYQGEIDDLKETGNSAGFSETRAETLANSLEGNGIALKEGFNSSSFYCCSYSSWSSSLCSIMRSFFWHVIKLKGFT